MAQQTQPAPQAGEKLITGEELLRMGDIGRAELVRGRIVRMSPTGHPHGFVECNAGYLLGDFVRRHKLPGRVLVGEVGIYTARNPDTVRGADVAFISNERLAQAQPQGYLDVAPELVVEVLSPDDRWSEVMEKLAEYFAIGVAMVWVVDPRRQQVYTYRSLTDVTILDNEEGVTGGEVLPGFRVPAAEFFAE